MSNSLLHIELGKRVDSRHVKGMMPDVKKDPLWELEKEEDRQAYYAAEEAQNKGGFYDEDYSF